MISRQTGQVRIIAGKWRSRKITFPNLPGLRPTHDRIRETLFNWLAPHIEGAHCLDLFAGSGALGFEALSRGATQVTFVDNVREVVSALEKNTQALDATGADILLTDCSEKITALTGAPFDIVFLDPPFYKHLIETTAGWLNQPNYLKKGALIYIEAEIALSPLPMPSNWKVRKEKKTASVQYALFEMH